MSKFGHRPHNWFEAVINKLGGEEAAESFLRGELVVKQVEKIFKLWKTIKLGTHKNADEIRKSLKTNGHNIGDWANDILGKMEISKTEEEVNLVVATVRELGFKNGANYADICKKAQELGLELCPAEVGPQLRLQYTNQPKGEWLIIAMEAISGSDGVLSVWNVERSDGGESWLDSYCGRADYGWVADGSFVFVSRK